MMEGFELVNMQKIANEVAIASNFYTIQKLIWEKRLLMIMVLHLLELQQRFLKFVMRILLHM